MPLTGIDKIIHYEPGKKLLAQKAIQDTEELFQDHFPGFPVYPGVMMLEGLVQAAAWYVLKTEEFSKSQAFLSELSNVKYSQLVRPNTVLQFDVALIEEGPEGYVFRGRVFNGSKAVCSARFCIQTQGLEGISPQHVKLEGEINEKNLWIFKELETPKTPQKGCKVESKSA